jgi:hypothetical protein
VTTNNCRRPRRRQRPDKPAKLGDAKLIASENPIPLSDLTRWCESSRTGEGIHISTAYRWVRNGLSGFRLGTVTKDGKLHTSEPEVFRFILNVAKFYERRLHQRRARAANRHSTSGVQTP